jgi:hypothetical protein
MANDFTSSANAVAWWNLEDNSGSPVLTSQHPTISNTLTDNNTVGTDTVNYKQGSASADVEFGNQEYLSITDANLHSSFPLKSGYTVDDFSAAFWYKAESQGSLRFLLGKHDFQSGKRSFFLRDNNGTLEFYIGYNGGASYELLDNSHSLSNATWYHIGATFNNTTKAWQLRVYEDGGVATTYSGTATNNISIGAGAFTIGASESAGTAIYWSDGLFDEVVVFDTDISITDIDAIRSGTYGAAGGVAPQWHHYSKNIG